jgi:translocation and assembly module TamB
MRAAMRGVALGRWLLALLVGLPALVLGFVGWLVATSAGTAWLLAQVPGLQVSAPRGALLGGTFEAARLQWQGGAGRLVVEDLRWTDLRWSWRPHERAWVGLDLVEPRAQRVEWRGSAEPSTGAFQAPTRLDLPVQARVSALQVERLEIDELPPIERLQLNAEVGVDGGRIHRVQQLTLTVDGLRLRARGDIGTDGELPLRWRADAESTPNRTPAWKGWLELEGPLQRLQARARVDVAEPAAGADVQATLAPFAAWPLIDLRLDSRDLDLAALARGAPVTRLTGRVEVRSSSLEAPIEADVALTNAVPGRWDRRRLPIASLDTTVRGTATDRSSVELTRLDLRLDGGRAPAGRVTGTARWQGDRLTLQAALADLQPARLDGRAPDLTLAGPLTLQIAGLPSPDPSAAAVADPRRLQATLQIVGRHRGLPGTPAVRVGGDLAGEQDGQRLRIDVGRLEATAGATRVALTASAVRNVAGAWAVASRGRVDQFDPAAWWPGGDHAALRAGPHHLNARWDGDVVVAAVPALATTRGRAEIEVVGSRLAGLPMDGRLGWAHPPGAAEAQATVELSVAGNRVEAEASIAAAGSPKGQVRLDAPRLDALRPLARLAPSLAPWWPQAGAIEGRIDADGAWPRLRTRGELALAGLQLPDAHLDRAQARWDAALDPTAEPDAPLQLTLELDGLARGEQRIDRLRARLDGTWSAHRIETDSSQPLRPPAWVDAWLATPADEAAAPGSALRLRGGGSWSRPAATGGAAEGGRWQGRIEELRLAPRDARGDPAEGGWLQARDVALQVAFDGDGTPSALQVAPGRLQVLDAALRWSDVQWRAASPGVNPALVVDAEVEPFAVAPWLVRLQPAFGWGGDLTVGATARLRLAERLEADIVVERIGGDLAVTESERRQALGLTDLRVALAARDGVWQVTQGIAAANIGVLAGAQTLRVPADTPWPDAQTPLEGVLELRVDNLGVWAPWVPPGYRLAGALRTSAAIGGRLGAPEYTGEIVGAGLGVRNLLQGVDVRDGELRVTLRGADAQVETFRLRAGDGTLGLTGGASFGDLPRARLELVADQFQLLGRVDRRIVVSGRADMELDREAIRVDGRFGVDRGLIDFSHRDAPSLDDDVTVVRRGEAPPEAAPAVARTPRRAVTVDVEVDLGERLRLRGRGLDTLLRGTLALSTPGGRLSLVGTVRAVEGTYNAYGQKLQIDRGNVIFAGPPDNPRLDILAVRPNLDVEVGVEIGGSAQSPRIRLYSDPAMSDADTLSWLILGRAPDGLGRADLALLQGAAMALLAGEGDGVAGSVLRTIGVDQLSVAPTQDGDVQGAVVTVGKQVSRNLFVAYERGVNATSGSWQLIYRVARRITVRAQTGDDTALDIIWSWRWN